VSAKFEATGAIYASPLIMADGTVVVGSLDSYVYFLNPDATEKARFKTGDWILSSPAMQSDGTIVVASADQKMYFINPDATLKTTVSTASIGVSAPLVLPDDGVVYGSSDHSIYFLNADGSARARFETGGQVLSQPALLADGTVAAGSDDGHLYFLNPATGQPGAAIELGGGRLTTALPLPDGGVVIGAGKTEYFLNSQHEVRATFDLPKGLTDQTQFQPALVGDRVVVVTSESIHSTALFLKLVSL
jgi:outer membrane protein assembly factor BamB